MNWLTNFVRPRIQRLVSGREQDMPDNLWQTCPGCGQMLFHRDLAENLHVCNHCGHHLRLDATQRLRMLFDAGEFSRIEPPGATSDPLRFRDRKRYGDRLKEARHKTGEDDAVIVAHGKLGGHLVVCAVFDFRFLGGSMGAAAGAALAAAARLAVLQQAPLIAIPASGGARMQEGILSLLQMPRTIVAVEEVREHGLPFIVVMTDPTTGGVLASFAMLGDVILAEPGATIGFTGKRVIQETIRQELPDDFQSSEYLQEHGMVDLVVPRKMLRGTLARLTGLLTRAPEPGELVALPAVNQTPESPSATPRGDRRAELANRPASDPAEPGP